MPLDEEAAPSWMDDKNDENHSLMFSSNQDSESVGNKDISSYGATQDVEDGEGKSVISTITADDNTLVTAGGTLEGPQKNIILIVFHVCVLLRFILIWSHTSLDSLTIPFFPIIALLFVLSNLLQWIEAFAIFSCATMMVTQIFPLFFIPLSDINAGAIVLKFYISIFCAVFILVELDAAIPFLKDSKILQNYFSRGFVYSFLGVVSVVTEIPSYG